MKNKKKSAKGRNEVELSDRPASYWTLEDPLAAILANISSPVRRQMITEHWKAGTLATLSDELLKDELDEDVRVQIGHIHPSYMGGEYLPKHLFDEVDIVRIGLESTTWDVIELRARRLPNGLIGVRWVDEYGTKFAQPTNEIACPFSFDELLDFICDSGPDEGSSGMFPLAYNKMNREYSTAKELRNFTTFGSDFYPGLREWCAGEVEAWIEEEKDEEESDEG